MIGTVKIGKDGRVAIPSAMVRQAGLEPGQHIGVWLRDDGAIVLRPSSGELITALRGSLRDGPSLTEELIPEHAEEIRRDEMRMASHSSPRAGRSG